MDAPPLPEKRKYSVQGGLKVYFPQIRVMRESANGEYHLNDQFHRIITKPNG